MIWIGAVDSRPLSMERRRMSYYATFDASITLSRDLDMDAIMEEVDLDMLMFSVKSWTADLRRIYILLRKVILTASFVMLTPSLEDLASQINMVSYMQTCRILPSIRWTVFCLLRMKNA